MKTAKIYIAVLIVIISILSILLIYRNNLSSDKSVQKYFGAAHMTINNMIGEDGITSNTTDIDSVVPSRDELVQNLTKKDYKITQYNNIDGLDLIDRIFAKKGKSFIDICYGLTPEDMAKVFKYYEETYPDYYVMAINGDYVYCVSDKKTFKRAGFTSLTNIGTQYLRE